MAEIKNQFTAGKMNKDLDERFVPNGQYTDALNIQLRTSDGGNSGVAQNIQGNALVVQTNNSTGTYSNSATCVGEVADEANDCIYFFMSARGREQIGPSNVMWMGSINPKIWVESSFITRYDAISGSRREIFRDVRCLHGDLHATVNLNTTLNPTGLDGTPAYTSIPFPDNLNHAVRRGAIITVWNNSQVWLANFVVKEVATDKLILTEEQTVDITTAYHWKIVNPPVLEFHPDITINSINILGDFLFWSDGVHEPKKINVERSKVGTNAASSTLNASPTILYVPRSNGNLINIANLEPGSDPHVSLEDITVMKGAPKQAPILEMSRSKREGLVEGNISNLSFIDSNGSGVSTGFMIPQVTLTPAGLDISQGDYLLLTSTSDESVTARVHVTELLQNTAAGQLVNISVESFHSDATSSNLDWRFVLEEDKPMFETKFGRFAYRYKFCDGEYSAFSPFSEIAFLPGEFEYEPFKGYNLGMANNIRNLKISGFVSLDIGRPDEVEEIDVLWKSTESPNVYIVKTITRDKDPEWEIQNAVGMPGSIHIASEMIHKVVPSSQLLRSWDNVPRTALAQEITGSRLLYGNYLHGYNPPKFYLDQNIYADTIKGSSQGVKSVKTLREYRFGVVFVDALGRETPVQAPTPRAKYNASTGHYTYSPAELKVPKKNSDNANSIVLKQSWLSPQGQTLLPPSWAKSFKYYVKETSNEYYTMVMDNWYDADDGNVWISFYSAERNKINEESYITLKNQHGTSIAVDEEARYKVLAISNQVPQHVKEEGFIMGINEIDAVQTSGGSEVLTIATVFNVNSNDFSLGVGSIIGSAGLGVDYMNARIVGQDGTRTHYSRWVRIINIDEDGTDTVKVYPDETFGGSADMDEIWTLNYGTTNNLSYHIQFQGIQAVNKTEFEGRFFVKINRDSTLEQNVCHETDAVNGTFWGTLDAFDVAFIALGGNNGTWSNGTNLGNPGVQGAFNTNQTYHDWFAGTSPQNDWYDDVLASWDWYTATSNGSVQDGGANALNGHVQRQHLCGTRTETRAFWQAWQQHRPAFWFIDDTMFYEHDSDYGIDAAMYLDDSDFPRPKGLYSSGNVGSDHDVLFFGAAHENNYFSDSENAFKQAMITSGTYFRFRDDPNQRVYVVVASSGGTQQAKNFAKNGQCNQCMTHWIGCPRSTFYTEFRRVNENTASILDEAINIGDWDPRSAVKHTGENTLKIEIVTPFDSAVGGKIKVKSQSGIWETEPTEDVGLDIYYEATNAFPLSLDHKNIHTHLQLGSKAVQVSRTPEGTTVPVLTAPDPVGVVDDFAFDCVWINEEDTVSYTNPDGIKFRDIVPGDIVTMRWTEGTEVQWKVKEHMQVNAEGVPVLSPRILPGNGWTVLPTGGSDTAIVLQDNDNTIIDQILAWHNSGYKIMVTGNNIPNGTFVAYSQYNMPFINYVDHTVQLTESFETPITAAYGTTSISFIAVTGLYQPYPDVYEYPVKLSWNNCYAFGNGVESDRIRDDFNAAQLDNGVKASTVLEDYGEELRSSGMIYSGIYNSNSGVNELNEFNMSEKITKDLNPEYGSLQALKTRDTNVVAFCEDKVLKILSNKDALFNADGNPNLTATNRVLGQSIPFVGDYGISKNPESLASDQYRLYFTDKQRGAVLRLSNDGLTPISNVGMKEYFRDNLRIAETLLGTFDDVAGEYNLTLKGRGKVPFTDTTVSFNEAGKGWVSFKSFIPEAGASVSGKYVTANSTYNSEPNIWEHYALVFQSTGSKWYNNFYTTQYISEIEFIFAGNPSEIKNFSTINYEGTKQSISQYRQSNVTDAAGNVLNNLSDNEFYNLNVQAGWQVTAFETDMQTGSAVEFIKKEGKYFANLTGASTTLDNLDEAEFTVQGIGEATSVTVADQTDFNLTIQSD